MEGLMLITTIGEFYVNETMEGLKKKRNACKDESSDMDFKQYTQDFGVFTDLNILAGTYRGAKVVIMPTKEQVEALKKEQEAKKK